MPAAWRDAIVSKTSCLNPYDINTTYELVSALCEFEAKSKNKRSSKPNGKRRRKDDYHPQKLKKKGRTAKHKKRNTKQRRKVVTVNSIRDIMITPTSSLRRSQEGRTGWGPIYSLKLTRQIHPILVYGTGRTKRRSSHVVWQQLTRNVIVEFRQLVSRKELLLLSQTQCGVADDWRAKRDSRIWFAWSFFCCNFPTGGVGFCRLFFVLWSRETRDMTASTIASQGCTYRTGCGTCSVSIVFAHTHYTPVFFSPLLSAE